SFFEGTDAWATAFCENHDNGRAVSRFGDDSTPALWRASAKTIALWQATMSGTLFLYQGQEIGMTNMPASWGIEEYKDIESGNFYSEAVASGDRARVDKTMHGLRILARDHSRIPFQWDAGPNPGFTREGATPWMRVHDDYGFINAAKQRGDPDSVLEFYRKLLLLRKRYRDVFIHGSHRLIDPENERTWVILKESPAPVSGKGAARRRRALVVMNFSKGKEGAGNVPALLGCEASEVRLLVGTREGGELVQGVAPVLGGWEARVYINFEVER
ncbi:glycoside hydrolase, partial [Colletotrichum somersetense]